MNKKAVFVLLLFILITITLLCGCGIPQKSAEKPSDEQILLAIKNYCYKINPDLENNVNSKVYPVYWDISSSDEYEVVVLFRSYTGVQNRYYIDRITGETYVTEYVPGITLKEQRTDESFNVRDYLYGD